MPGASGFAWDLQPARIDRAILERNHRARHIGPVRTSTRIGHADRLFYTTSRSPMAAWMAWLRRARRPPPGRTEVHRYVGRRRPVLGRMFTRDAFRSACQEVPCEPISR